MRWLYPDRSDDFTRGTRHRSHGGNWDVAMGRAWFGSQFQGDAGTFPGGGSTETKQVGPWEYLLSDDLDQDGVPELHMQDDGIRDDLKSSDGIFTASLDQDGIHLVWTVELNRVGPLGSAGMAWIEARARYESIPGQTREIRLRTLRANPKYTRPH